MKYSKRSLCAAMALSLSVAASAAEPELKPVWQTGPVFEHPESVAYDTTTNALYLSNIKGEFGAADGDGYIAKLSLAGEVLEAHWVTGLNAPKGMAVKGRQLFIADLTELVVIDLDQAKIVKRYKAADNSFLNDVAITSEGEVYLTDTATNRIYQLKDDVLEVWLETPLLESPNGLFADQGKLIVASWGVPTEGWSTKVPGHLLEISLDDRQVVSFGSDQPVGNLDGIWRYDARSFISTDWMAGKLYHIDDAGKVNTLLTLTQGSADMLYMQSSGLLLIPQMLDGQLRAYKIK
ncbi:SMP-30/gluconolactonase/LRE family protein [Pontibacter sp. JAM-7]|uniref:SMP-30/gluconolactonase/LRE family protein n=1 Tax=Pontibacter sp. JAM-7 TaxID=3366581 RepID=UPI003AF578A3